MHSHLYIPESLKAIYESERGAMQAKRKMLDGRFMEEYHSNYTIETYISEMDDAGIDKAVIQIRDEPALPGQPATINVEYVYDNVISKYPDRLMLFASYSPMTLDGAFNRKALERFEKVVEEYDVKGLGELGPPYEHWSPGDKRMYPFYEKCIELGVPVAMHMGVAWHRTMLLKYGAPELFEETAIDFPELKVNLCHMAHPNAPQLLAIMGKFNSNVYTDISYLCEVGKTTLTRYLTTAKEFGVIDRVMFGTDSGCRPPKYYIQFLKTELNILAEKAGLPKLTQEDINGILGNNAMRFLGLK